MRLFQVCYVVQTKRSVLSLAWDEWFSCKGRERKDFLLRARVVVRTSRLKISRRRLADYEELLYQKACVHVQHDYFSSNNQSNH